MTEIKINNNIFSFDYSIYDNSVQLRAYWGSIVVGAYIVVDTLKENKNSKFTVFYKDTPYANTKKKDFRYGDRDIITGRSIDRSLRPFLKNINQDVTLNVILFQNTKNESIFFPTIMASILVVYLSGGNVKNMYAIQKISETIKLLATLKKTDVVMMEGFFNCVDHMEIMNILEDNSYIDFWHQVNEKISIKNPPLITYKTLVKEENTIVKNILKNKRRLDNRKFSEIRSIKVKLLPLKNTLSVIFSRGITEVMTVLNYLGSEKNEIFFHYNFHPFSVEELGDTIGTSRREKGHSYIITNTLNSLIKNIPLLFKLYGEVIRCNGSSSMASINGGSICLNQLLGIPLISGVALGLIDNNNKKQVIIVDLTSDEDAFSKCDFKVTNNKEGKIFNIFMDSSLGVISLENIKKLFEKGIKSNISIIKKMEKSLVSDEVNKKFSSFLFIKKEKIPYLIGSGGNNIKEIMDLTSSWIRVFDNGLVIINCKNKNNVNIVKSIVNSYNTLVDKQEVTCIVKNKNFNKNIFYINLGIFTFSTNKFKFDKQTIIRGHVVIKNKSISLENIKKIKIKTNI
ncbi:hypothetical protein AB836_01490 [Rickettsiales bacterium (ex Bugula neritina AB1)]|nr:hypothetical protein AB836_01490 [Rickettsiales bacterium (ex Bugula neritina AB1)]